MATVLLIEDDPRYSMMVLMMLESGGHTVRYAASGLQALESLEQARPDLVITDILMPRFDGLDTIASIREKDSSLPIIAISGAGDQVLSAAKERGASTILPKPFDVTALLSAVAVMVGV